MTREPLADEAAEAPVRHREVVMTGRVWDVVRDEVDLGDAGVHVREYVRHPGAVAVLALDDDGRACLIQQYRHPIRTREWEIPAGLLDVPGEPAWDAAARELREEADLTATTWHVLADIRPSPGGLDEAIRIFLARDLGPVPHEDRYVREAEEHGMPVRWEPLDEIVDAVLAGRLQNSILGVAVLAARASRERDWATLRPHDCFWTQQPGGSRPS